jgi:hypothetical protein
VNGYYLYHHALRGHRSLSTRVRWWFRFRLPQFAADLTKVTLVMGGVAGFLTLFNHI